ncbi:MAG: hypothetical protein CR972_04095 [Candidatus Moraniibacteriota bacterium]|nr:MAG: hypothetical protein CR972_04095 [Candidatus Moranbacteria bacterium]
MKNSKIFFISLFLTIVTFPSIALAQLTKPTQSHGLVHNHSFLGVLEGVLYWILRITASLSILMIVIAGVIYVTSGGDQGRVDTAKKMLTFAIVGLIVALLGFVITSAVSNALGAG